MSLPLSDAALVGTCLAASALGLLVMTSGGGSSPAPAPAQVAMVAEPEETATTDALAALGAEPVEDAASVSVDADFGEQVRAYLLQNPEVIFEAVAAFEQRNAAAQANMDGEIVAANADAIFNDGFSWVGGNPDGDVTLVKFNDYRCGFCQRAHDEVLTLLEMDDNIRLIVKEFPILGPDSELASRFAIAVLHEEGDDAYETVHSMLLRHEGAVTIETLSEMAEALELDFDNITEAMGEQSVTEILAQNRALAQRLQITGTPTFVMGNEMIRGFVGVDVLLEVAEDQRG